MSSRSADIIVRNARVSTGRVGAPQHEAVAISHDRIIAVGTEDEVSQRATRDTVVLDAGGRRMIPGLIDSHIHLARAGLTWSRQLDWSRVRTLAAALELIERAVSEQPPGTWIQVVGGWHPGYFEEGRGPTPDELSELAPEHPVYVQLLYESAVLNRVGLAAIGMDASAPDPAMGSFERDADGRPTGHGRGIGVFQRCLQAIGRPDHEEQVASTGQLLRRLNSLGLTGAIDPGGMGMNPEAYRPLHELNQRGDLTIRTGIYLMPSERGREREQLTTYVQHQFPGFGDGHLRIVGLGEILHFGCSDLEGVGPFEVSADARAELLEITLLAARHRWPVHLHAVLPSTIDAVLDVWEEAADQVPLSARFSLAHAEPISDRNLDRVAALGAGIAVQDRMLFRAADSAAFWGDDVLRRSPPLRGILERGIPLGAGTDATVVSPYDPWWCLWWLITGRSLDGAPPRDPEHRLTREEALHAYTAGSAWFSYDERERGLLEPGMLADLAVLSEDLMEVDEDHIPGIEAELTLVGGRTVHDTGAVTRSVADPMDAAETAR